MSQEYRWIWRYSPVQWWFVCLCMAFVWFVLIVFLLGSVQALKHTLDDPTAKQAGPEIPYRLQTRGLDNTVYITYHNPTKGINLTWSSNLTSWEKDEVWPFGKDGSSDPRPRGIVISSNNTTVILISVLDVSGYQKYSLWLALNYSMSAPCWNFRLVAESDLAPWNNHDLSIDPADNVLISYDKSPKIYYRIWNMSANNLESEQEFATYTSVDSRSTCNVSGDFWFAWIYHDGSNFQLAIRDLNKTEPLVTTQLSSARNPYLSCFMCLPNDILAITYGEYWGGNLNDYVYFAYGKASISKKLLIQTDHDILINNIGLSITQGNFAYVTYWDHDDSRLYQHSGPYNQTQADWQSSKETLYEPGDGDVVYTTEGAENLKIQQSKYMAIPASGYAWVWVWRDELGATDDLFWEFCWNATWDYQVYSDPPEITTTSLPQGTVGVFYIKVLTATGGEAPLSWSLITSPYWLSLGPSNGTLYGLPDSSGVYTVTARVTDDVGRTDDETWSLTIIPEESEPSGEGWSGFAEAFLGGLWWLFITFAVVIALFDVLLKFKRKEPLYDVKEDGR